MFKKPLIPKIPENLEYLVIYAKMGLLGDKYEKNTTGDIFNHF